MISWHSRLNGKIHCVYYTNNALVRVFVFVFVEDEKKTENIVNCQALAPNESNYHFPYAKISEVLRRNPEDSAHCQCTQFKPSQSNTQQAYRTETRTASLPSLMSRRIPLLQMDYVCTN